mmetsp:Transcript_17041/g.42676  ORF Transcript_17041/g.42676 Transcript_17041/m.42676 type:complete len:202 (-) Transcript_17041:2345-2950(-)
MSSTSRLSRPSGLSGRCLRRGCDSTSGRATWVVLLPAPAPLALPPPAAATAAPAAAAPAGPPKVEARPWCGGEVAVDGGAVPAGTGTPDASASATATMDRGEGGSGWVALGSAMPRSTPGAGEGPRVGVAALLASHPASVGSFTLWWCAPAAAAAAAAASGTVPGGRTRVGEMGGEGVAAAVEVTGVLAAVALLGSWVSCA